MTTQTQSTKSNRSTRRAAKNKGSKAVDVTQTIKDALAGKINAKDAAALVAGNTDDVSQNTRDATDSNGTTSTGADTSTGAESAVAPANGQQTGDKAPTDPANTGEQQAPQEPSIADIGKNNKGKRRGPTGPRTGAQAGAKPLIRALLGTVQEDGTFKRLTLDEICTETKKSDVNVRTILSDLRSAKYCGQGGIFKTDSVKGPDGKTRYFWADAPVVKATKAVTEEPSPDDAKDTPTDAQV